MSVTATRACRPHPRESPRHASASASASSGDFMNAPAPAFTSSRIRSVSTASFFDITLAAISGIDGTVAVASRSAYSLPSAGTSRGDWAATAHPTSRTWRVIASGSRSVRSPGIDSSLSSVPPVCPSPRPESLATARPRAAASGAKTRVTPSATPPVECLSTVGRSRPTKRTVSPEAMSARVRASVSAPSMPRSKHAIRKADASASSISPRV